MTSISVSPPRRLPPRLRTGALALLLAVGLLLPAHAGAQGLGDEGWRATRIAKWSLLLLAAGAGLYGYSEMRRADDRYDALRDLCVREPARCELGADGRYADAAAERLFARTQDHDRRARVGIIGGNVALLGATAFFIVDLGGDDEPDNVPYDPDRLRHAARTRAAFGIRLPLRLPGSGR